MTRYETSDLKLQTFNHKPHITNHVLHITYTYFTYNILTTRTVTSEGLARGEAFSRQ